MAVVHGKGSKVFIANYDFSGQGRSLRPGITVDTPNASTFDSALSGGHEFVEGQYKGTIAHKGVFTDAVSGLDQWLYSKLGSLSGQPISIVPGQVGEGAIAFNAEIAQSSVKIAVPVDDIVAIDATYEVKGPLGLNGKLIGLQTTTARGTFVGSGHYVGYIGSNEMWLASMHVISYAGTGAFNIWLEHVSGEVSANYAAIAATRISATNITSKIVRVSGALNDYARVHTTVDSGATGKYCVVVSKMNRQ